jgi:hypothetical protein
MRGYGGENETEVNQRIGKIGDWEAAARRQRRGGGEETARRQRGGGEEAAKRRQGDREAAARRRRGDSEEAAKRHTKWGRGENGAVGKERNNTTTQN